MQMEMLRNYHISLQEIVHFPVLYVGYSQVALFPNVQVRHFLSQRKIHANSKINLLCTEKF